MGAKRYFGTVELNPLRASTQMGRVHEEVISHLIAAGANVSISIDISAENGAGFPERIRKIVLQNAGDLKFTQSSFEAE